MGYVSRLINHFHQKIIWIPTQLQLNKFTKSIHTTNDDHVTNLLCTYLRNEQPIWSTMSEKFHSMKITNTIIDKVLVELKDPLDAKKALSFFHWSSHQFKNIEHGVESYCMVVHTLVRARLLVDAKVLLETAVRKSCKYDSTGFIVVEMMFSSYKKMSSVPLVFDLLIQTYSKFRMFDTAFQACRFIEEHGLSCSIISCNTLIHLVQKSGRNELVWKIYEFMIERRIYPNESTTKTMINALCKEGKLQKSIDVLDRIHGKRCSPGVIVNTYLVYGMLEDGRIDEGVVLMKRMLQKNMIIDDVAYSLIIFAKLKADNLESAMELYDEMLKRGFHANPFLYTLFIRARCKEGSIEEANNLMQEMHSVGSKPYDETYNALVEGCSAAGRIEESLRYCEEMVNVGFSPSCFAFNEMVRKLCDISDVQKANAMLTVLLEKGFLPNEATYAYLMDGYGKEGEVQEVLKLYYEMEYRKHSLGFMAYTSIIRSLCQVGKLKDAEKCLRVMKERLIAPNQTIYETLISGHCRNGNMVRARELYDEMVGKKLTPTCDSFTALVERNS